MPVSAAPAPAAFMPVGSRLKVPAPRALRLELDAPLVSSPMKPVSVAPEPAA